MSETDLSKAIRDALTRRGFWVERIGAGGYRGRAVGAKPGTPDILIIAPVYAWLEVKTETGRLSDHQVAWHDRARSFGVRVEVVRSVEGALRAVEALVRERREQLEFEAKGVA